MTAPAPTLRISKTINFREQTMKAAVYYENGPPSVLKYEDVADPECLPQGIALGM